MMPLWSPERPPISSRFIRLLSRWHKARKHSELYRERGLREAREVREALLSVAAKETATSKFGNCFLDWPGRSGSLISVGSLATCLKLLKFYQRQSTTGRNAEKVLKVEARRCQFVAQGKIRREVNLIISAERTYRRAARWSLPNCLFKLGNLSWSSRNTDSKWNWQR